MRKKSEVRSQKSEIGQKPEVLTSAVRPPTSGFRVRAGQREFERGIEEHRIAGFLTRRQYGKTTEAARIALKNMMRTAGHTVVFGSVKLDLAREIVRKESEAMQKAFRLLAQIAGSAASGDPGYMLDVVDTGKGKSVAAISLDDWSELYESQRLEFRLYHSRTIYSRTKVVALSPSAVGETGDLILDEVGRVKQFREVWEAVMPIIASNPDFRCILTTTPPPDDTHYSFELLAPPIDFDPPANAAGHWYRSDLGVWVLRMTAWDAHQDGVALYDDDSGAAITPAESRARAHDKDAWDRNYGVRFVIGGTSACGLVVLDTAQRRGIGQCGLFVVQSDLEFDQALRWLADHLGANRIGIGFDVATTTKGVSNPSVCGLIEDGGNELVLRAALVWKVADPDVALERLRRIVQVVRAREAGGPARRLCIDATNERYFAQTVRKELAAEVPVELVIASETIAVPGEDTPQNMKQFLGGQLVAELDDNHLTLPPERYLREDWRLVKKEKGQFVCEPDVEGRHGDTFDGAKLALHALRSTSGAITTTEGMHVPAPKFKPRRLFTPRRLVPA